jgi:4-amino-4-deoxy-L-arabinose transferase-like glycosyltransferase
MYLSSSNGFLDTMSYSRVRTFHWIAVALIFIFFLTRVYHLLALPFFFDEASHLTRAQNVWLGKPFYLLETGKALAPYLAAAFWPFQGATFLGRYVVVFLGAIGLASAYAVGRELHSRTAGLFIMILWIACPQLFFYERMALVDTTISAMAMLALFLAIRTLRGGKISMAVGCGVALALTVLAKLTGIVYLCIPVLVLLCVPAKQPILRRLRGVFIAYIVLGLILIGPYLYIKSTDSDPTGQQYGLTTTSLDDLSSRMQGNLDRAKQADITYLSVPMLIVIFGAGAYLLTMMPRRAVMLILLAAVLIGAVTFAGESIWLRYVVPSTPFMLLWTAIALTVFMATWKDMARPVQVAFALVPAIVLGLWVFSWGLPFMLTAYTNPAALTLPNCFQCDQTEYVRWIPSGFGIREAVEYIQQNVKTPEVIIGSAVNCNTARLMMPYDSPITFKCYDLNWGGGNFNVIGDMTMQRDLNGHVYVLGENIAIVNEYQFPDPWCVVKRFPRPDSDYFVTLYYIGGDANDNVCPTPTTQK